MWNKLNQRAALFGMDARIALVAMGVAAASIGIISISHVSEGKIYQATQHINRLRDGIMGVYYQDPWTYGSSGLTDPAAYNLQYTTRDASESGEDPWGNLYVINRVTVSKYLMGNSVTADQVNVVFFTIVSGGPDGVVDSTTIATEADYQSWAPADDDIGYKFSTYDYAREAVIDSRQRLEKIAARLQQYERGIFETLRTYCDTPANQLTSTCDFNGNGAYVVDEEFQSNLYPKSTGENTATKYYSATTYTSGNAASMESLLTLIGFTDATYVKDKMGRTLRYTSNATGATVAPFAARVWYQ